MLSRLAELRDLAQGSVPELDDPDKEASGQAGQKEQLANDEYAEMLAEMQLQYKEILEDEGVATQAFEEVRLRVESMEELVQLQKEALLPSKLQQLANRFEGQELVCQRMIRRAKEALTALRAEDADVDEDDIVHIALNPVRNNIARVRSKEFKDLVQGFFTARAHNREEMLIRATRQLRYAYPDALDEELNDILEFPELAAVAISQRLEKGAEGVTLDGILAEMEGKKADAKKLEQGAKELKLMFMQFAELIDNQGENLTAIESNIKTVIEETTEAIDNLLDAEAEKRAYERKWMKFYFIAFILVCWLILWPVYKALFRRDDYYRRPQRQGWASYLFSGARGALSSAEREAIREERSIEREFERTGKNGGSKGSDRGSDVGGGRGITASIGDGLSSAAHSVGGVLSNAGNAAYNLVAGEKKGRKDNSGDSSSLAEVVRHQKLDVKQAYTGGNAFVATESRQRPKSTGFIAPRADSEGTISNDLSFESLAVNARGGAARQSALRKQHLSPRD